MNRPQIMGILNCTPDSFYDGGKYSSAQALVERGLEMFSEGADWIDVGGESTRPGASPVSVGEELERVIPVIEGVIQKGVKAVSIDTTKSVVAREAIRAGASMANDVSGLRADPEMVKQIAAAGAHIVLMHSRGTPQTMQGLTQYDDVVADVMRELKGSVDRTLAAGIDRSKIIIDPGFGFAKTAEQNLRLLRELAKFCGLGFPVMVGLSRKSFIGAVTGDESPSERLAATLAAACFASLEGASYFRVHDVAETRRALHLISALR